MTNFITYIPAGLGLITWTILELTTQFRFNTNVAVALTVAGILAFLVIIYLFLRKQKIFHNGTAK